MGDQAHLAGKRGAAGGGDDQANSVTTHPPTHTHACVRVCTHAPVQGLGLWRVSRTGAVFLLRPALRLVSVFGLQTPHYSCEPVARVPRAASFMELLGSLTAYTVGVKHYRKVVGGGEPPPSLPAPGAAVVLAREHGHRCAKRRGQKGKQRAYRQGGCRPLPSSPRLAAALLHAPSSRRISRVRLPFPSHSLAPRPDWLPDAAPHRPPRASDGRRLLHRVGPRVDEAQRRVQPAVLAAPRADFQGERPPRPRGVRGVAGGRAGERRAWLWRCKSGRGERRFAPLVLAAATASPCHYTDALAWFCPSPFRWQRFTPDGNMVWENGRLGAGRWEAQRRNARGRRGGGARLPQVDSGEPCWVLLNSRLSAGKQTAVRAQRFNQTQPAYTLNTTTPTCSLEKMAGRLVPPTPRLSELAPPPTPPCRTAGGLQLLSRGMRPGRAGAAFRRRRGGLWHHVGRTRARALPPGVAALPAQRAPFAWEGTPPSKAPAASFASPASRRVAPAKLSPSNCTSALQRIRIPTHPFLCQAGGLASTSAGGRRERALGGPKRVCEAFAATLLAGFWPGRRASC
jgi:hypothetical protein